MALKKKVSPTRSTPLKIKPITTPKQKFEAKKMALSPTTKKVLTGAAIGLGAAALGVGAAKVVKSFSGKRSKRQSVKKLQSKVLKTKLKIELIKAQRKLNSEMLKV